MCLPSNLWSYRSFYVAANLPSPLIYLVMRRPKFLNLAPVFHPYFVFWISLHPSIFGFSSGSWIASFAFHLSLHLSFLGFSGFYISFFALVCVRVRAQWYTYLSVYLPDWRCRYLPNCLWRLSVCHICLAASFLRLFAHLFASCLSTHLAFVRSVLRWRLHFCLASASSFFCLYLRFLKVKCFSPLYLHFWFSLLLPWSSRGSEHHSASGNVKH